MATDPVCKMNVDPANAAAKAEYAGQTYYFCCAACQKTFTAQPDKYVSGAARAGHAPGGTHHHGHT
ncbi:MAG: YHS domain-containing protein [Betaproteobacteria bacterium]|nr:YHS domain-containing protein [Betaproteobacteria bacterium]